MHKENGERRRRGRLCDADKGRGVSRWGVVGVGRSRLAHDGRTALLLADGDLHKGLEECFEHCSHNHEPDGTSHRLVAERSDGTKHILEGYTYKYVTMRTLQTLLTTAKTMWTIMALRTPMAMTRARGSRWGGS